MKILVICDNPDTFSPDKDTTRAIIERGWERNHELYSVHHSNLVWDKNYLGGMCRKLERHESSDGLWLKNHPEEMMPIAEYDGILMRSDPPVLDDYVRALQLISLETVPVFNAISALLLHNEKVSAHRFHQYMPHTILASNQDLLDNFADKNPKGVYKSLDSLGGEGVAAYSNQDPDQRKKTRTTLLDFADSGSYFQAQAWIPEVLEGDKRVIVIDGQYHGAIVRIPTGEEFRGNIHMGGRVEYTDLNAREKEIVDTVSPWLIHEGILLAGLDLVGGKLTEINITSPTGFREIERLTDYRPTIAFWEAVEKKITNLHA